MQKAYKDKTNKSILKRSAFLFVCGVVVPPNVSINLKFGYPLEKLRISSLFLSMLLR